MLTADILIVNQFVSTCSKYEIFIETCVFSLLIKRKRQKYMKNRGFIFIFMFIYEI